jgi:serine/threonine-protein kinase
MADSLLWAPRDEATITAGGAPREIDFTSDPLAGRQVGAWRLVRRLGVGAMGSVYLAERDKGRAAMKLPQRPGRSMELEARLTTLAQHPNVVTVHGVCQLPWGGSAMLMEHLAGPSLRELLASGARRVAKLPIFRQLCGAVATAHRRGVVHCDLKPANVLLVPRGATEHFVKLIDWGIARGPGVPPLPDGSVVGTPRYMAPEQGRGKAVDARTDVYALGLIAYELATGRYPFDGVTPSRLSEQHRAERPAPPSELSPSVPRAVSDAIMRALEKQPSRRFADASELGAALSPRTTP